jgi:hypothetical protein
MTVDSKASVGIRGEKKIPIDYDIKKSSSIFIVVVVIVDVAHKYSTKQSIFYLTLHFFFLSIKSEQFSCRFRFPLFKVWIWNQFTYLLAVENIFFLYAYMYPCRMSLFVSCLHNKLFVVS